MATKTSILKVTILSDASDARKDLEETGNAANKAGDKIQEGGKKAKDGLDKQGKAAKDASGKLAGFKSAVERMRAPLDKIANWATVAGAAWSGLAKVSLDAASEMQQNTGAVESVFKDQAQAIKDFAADAAQAVGLSASQYSEMAALIGSQLKNLGISQEELVPTTDKLIQMGADLSSMYGGTTKEAVEALSAAFRGEYDPIERYALGIRKSDINAGLAAKGLNGLEGEALRTAETQELLSLLTQQSADATGNFAKEADTMAGQQQRANAEWENAKANLGEQLLPIMTEAFDVLGDIANVVGQQPGLFIAAGVAIGGIIGTIKLLTGVVTIFNAVAAMNPVVLGIMAVIGTLAGLYWAFKEAYEHCEWFRNAVDSSVQWLKDSWQSFINKLKEARDWFRKLRELASPSNWLRGKVSFSFSHGYEPLKAIQPPESLFRFMPAPATTFAGAPDITAAAPTINLGGFFAAPRPSTTAAPVINVTVNGAVDPIATGKQLEGILNDWAKRKQWRQ